jgi:OOP family OmpA-OmpF porin
MKLKPCLTAVALLAVTIFATNAAAQSDPDFVDGARWYGALGVGYHWPATVDSHSTGLAPDGRPYDWQWKTQSSVAVVARLGYRFTPHIRGEIETGYYNSSLLSVQAPGGTAGGVSIARPGEPYGLCSRTSPANGCIPAGGSPGSWTWMLAGMANVIYDVLPDQRLDPFIGAGVGIAHVEWAGDALTYRFSNVPGTISPANPAVQTLKDAGTLDRISQLAFQVLGGVSYRVAPKVHLDLTYYYYLTPNNLRWNPVNNTPGLAVGAGLRPGDFLGKFQDQSLIVACRYAF